VLYLGDGVRRLVDMLSQLFYLLETTLKPIKQESGWTPEPVLAFRRKETLIPLPGCEARNIEPITTPLCSIFKI
jgi:hypothetical protein